MKAISPYDDPLWPFHLFVSKKFTLHRILGLVYLLQYVWAWKLYMTDFQTFITSPIVWTLPINGVLQSITATYYFSFLPKKQDPGYYSDKSALSFTFVAENIFFASILAFQWLYYAEPYYSAMRRGVVFEQFFVFLPYFARPLFPKTRFRDSLNNPSNKSEANATFFFYATWITKIFYVWAKHFIGFGLNYLRFLNKPDAVDQEHMYGLLLWSAFATTISMFLHTLKFKGYLEAKLSFLIYMASYLATFYAIVKLGPLLLSSPLVLAVVAVGAVVNFGPSWAFYVYQIGVLLLLNAVRRGVLDIPL